MGVFWCLSDDVPRVGLALAGKELVLASLPAMVLPPIWTRMKAFGRCTSFRSGWHESQTEKHVKVTTQLSGIGGYISKTDFCWVLERKLLIKRG